jgi:acyl-CoA synthetase (AMP-forming)/AMP-acid ligase II
MTWLAHIDAVHCGNDWPAVFDATGPVSGRALIGKAVYAAELLTTLESRPGRAVPALLTVNADALALLLGGAAANRPLAPLGPRLTPAELAAVLFATDARVLLTEPAFAETARAAAELANVRVVSLGSLPSSVGRLDGNCEVAFHLHTAGTTGAPKPVAFTPSVLVARGEVLTELVGFGAGDRYATGSPIHHIGGLGNVLAALGAGAAILPTTHFSAAWWRSLREFGATHCLLVPSMIEMLLQDGLLDAVPLRSLIYGASPITEYTLSRVLHTLPGVRVVSLFGQTEGSPITSLGPDDHRRAVEGAPHLLGTVGRAVPGLRLAIDSPDETGTGEVLAAASHLSVCGLDGWLHTGDLGVIDADGYLRLVGRQHDMVVRGGENVYPVEVENVLCSHPRVAAAAVIGVADTRLGETLAAYIVPVDRHDPPDENDLRSFTRARLSGFKVPATWSLLDRLPRNSAGKLNRMALRQMHDRAGG